MSPDGRDQRAPGTRRLSRCFRAPDALWKAYSLATGFVADVAVPSFDIGTFRAYVGTVALVWAATVAIYLPLYLVRRRRAMA
jgi:hypothetical protein